MLKQLRRSYGKIKLGPAAFRRLCVETEFYVLNCVEKNQPPSGGCVLKQNRLDFGEQSIQPAAFRRLCVETSSRLACTMRGGPAAFRRLCVETFGIVLHCLISCPAAFRRLCVETLSALFSVAVSAAQPPSGGCVLKPTHGGG